MSPEPKISQTTIPGLLLIEPKVFGDERGFFLESWNYRTFKNLGLPHFFVQDNHSRSAKGVLRGLHFQKQQPQGKLIRVVSGSIYDVAVDLRAGSPSFGKWLGFTLDAKSKTQLFVPEGFAHGFLTLEDNTEVFYKCTDFYDPTDEVSLRWDDADLKITWPLNGLAPVLSEKDKKGLALKDCRYDSIR
jgi:dTDP-4-dehydrorhamnose 3,5-epimerase